MVAQRPHTGRMSDTPLAERLQLRPAQRIRLIGAPAGYAEHLGRLPVGARLVDDADAPADALQLFVRTRDELESARATAVAAVSHGGLLWVAYPKLSSASRGDLSRDVVAELMRPVGWHPVRQIAIDDTWSALRFRPDA